MIPHWTTLVIGLLMVLSISASYYVMVINRDFEVLRNEDGIPIIDDSSVLQAEEEVMNAPE
jgi:hypothetical protein